MRFVSKHYYCRSFHYYSIGFISILALLAIQFSSSWIAWLSYFTNNTNHHLRKESGNRLSSLHSSLLPSREDTIQRNVDDEKHEQLEVLPRLNNPSVSVNRIVSASAIQESSSSAVQPYTPRIALSTVPATNYRICCIGVSPEETCWIYSYPNGRPYPILFHINTYQNYDISTAVLNYARYYEDYACGQAYITSSLCSFLGSSNNDLYRIFKERFPDRIYWIPDDLTIIRTDNNTKNNKYYCYNSTTKDYELVPIDPSLVVSELSTILTLYTIRTVFTIQKNVRIPDYIFSFIDNRNYTVMVQGIQGTEDNYHLQQYINRSTVVPLHPSRMYNTHSNRPFSSTEGTTTTITTTTYAKVENPFTLIEKHRLNKRKIYNTYLRQKAEAIELQLQANSMDRMLDTPSVTVNTVSPHSPSTSSTTASSTVTTNNTTTTTGTGSSSSTPNIPTTIVPPKNFPILRFVTNDETIPHKSYVTVVPWILSFKSMDESRSQGLQFTFNSNAQSFETFYQNILHRPQQFQEQKLQIYKRLNIPEQATVMIVYGEKNTKENTPIIQLLYREELCKLIRESSSLVYFIFVNMDAVFTCYKEDNSGIEEEPNTMISTEMNSNVHSATDSSEGTRNRSNLFFDTDGYAVPNMYFIYSSVYLNEIDKYTLLSLGHACIYLSTEKKDESAFITVISECRLMGKRVLKYYHGVPDNKDGQDIKNNSNDGANLVAKLKTFISQKDSPSEGTVFFQQQNYNQHNPHKVMKDFLFHFGIFSKVVQYNQGIVIL